MSDLSLDKIRNQLALFIRQEGLPVGAFWGRESSLVADAQGLVRSNHSPVAQQLESLSLVRLSFLAERGIRGQDLAAKLAVPAEPVIDDARYQTLIDELDRMGHEASYRRIEDDDQKARKAGQLIGRLLYEPFADGYAIYVVTQTHGEEARIRHLPVGDAWVVPTLGKDSWLSLDYVESSIQRRDELADTMKSWNKKARL
jgi:hypothetical protein